MDEHEARFPAASREPRATSARSASFDTVAIVGVGLIGGSIGLALRERMLARRVIGVVRREETAGQARERGAVDEATMDLCGAAAEADLVVLCVPVLTIPGLVEQLAPGLRPGTIVTDVGSTKAYLAREVTRRLPATATFIGGHPMAGSERGGVGAARADLFDGATWVICAPSGAVPGAWCPVPGSEPELPGESGRSMVRGLPPSPPGTGHRAPGTAPEGRLAAWVAALGARPVLMDPSTHDRVVAAISHLPHVAAAALVNAVVAGGEDRAVLRSFIAGGFTSTTRIASSPPELWRDICLTNRPAVLATLGHLREALARFEDALGREDGDALLAAFGDARTAREELIQR